MQVTLIYAGSILVRIISWLLIISCLISWLPISRDNPIVRFLHSVTEPMLAPLRRISCFGGLDLSPMLALLSLDVVVFPLYKMLVLAIF
jgi:YggT family protein